MKQLILTKPTGDNDGGVLLIGSFTPTGLNNYLRKEIHKHIEEIREHDLRWSDFSLTNESYDGLYYQLYAMKPNAIMDDPKTYISYGITYRGKDDGCSKKKFQDDNPVLSVYNNRTEKRNKYTIDEFVGTF